MKILYIGADALGTTSQQRADALRRLGHHVDIVNPACVLPASRVLCKIHYRTGYRLLTRAALRVIQEHVGDQRFDISWVDGGYMLSPVCIQWLKSRSQFVINYCNDDPTGPRDASKWMTFRRAIPDYDLCVVVREFNRQEYLEHGARKVLRVMMGYDEVAHARLPYSADDRSKWSSEVAFAGTWMPERGPFMVELLRQGIPLTIYGDHWQKAREWDAIKPCWRGPAIYGADYIKAIQYARVAIGMLSKGNRDLHTQRSAEVPFIGTAFCAERTSEHSEMYREGEEAVFWSDAEECAAACCDLLQDEIKRERMANAARVKIQSLELGNETVCHRILQTMAPEPALKQ